MRRTLAWAEYLCLLPAKGTEREFHRGLITLWTKTDANVTLVTAWLGAEEELEKFCYFAVESAGGVEYPLRTGQVDRFYHPFARPFLAGSVGRISSPWHVPEAL